MGIVQATKFLGAIVAFKFKWRKAKDMNQKYDASITLWKAVLAFIATFAGGWLLDIVQALNGVAVPGSLEELKLSWPTVALAVLLGVLQALRNWLKHRDTGVD